MKKLILLIVLVAGCSSVNPLIKPYDNVVNKTLVPRLEKYIEKDQELHQTEKDAIWYEIQAHRALLREAKK